MTEEMKNLDYSDIITLLIAICLQYSAIRDFTSSFIKILNFTIFRTKSIDIGFAML